MRVAAGVLVLISFMTQLLWGGGLLLSAKVEQVKARTKAEDLSAVAGDLVDEQELAKQRAAAQARMDTTPATTRLALAIAASVSAAGLLMGGILMLLGRRRRLTQLLVGLPLVLGVGILFASSVSTVGLITIGGAVVGLGLHLLSKTPQAAN